MSQNRLYGRLRSKHWIPPPYLFKHKRGPLYEELQNLSARILQQRPKLWKTSRALIQQLNELSKTYESIDSLSKDSPQNIQRLKQIVKKSHAFCTSNGRKTIKETIQEYGLMPSQILTDKRIEQVNKIGLYWSFCIYVTEASRKYPKVFEKVDLHTIIPYRGLKSPISPNMVYVHAEVQLVTFYELNPTTTTLSPRVLGTSKEACYLCNLFLLSHGRFFITKTHGHLYPHWNIPNLAIYSQPQLREYRHIIVMMDREIRKALLEHKRGNRNLPHPMTSSTNLPGGRQISPLPSDAGTLISENQANSIHGLTPFARHSPAIIVEHVDVETPLANPVWVQNEAVPSPLRLPSPIFEPRATQISATTSFEQSPSISSFTRPIHNQESTFPSPITIIPGQILVQRIISEIAPLRIQAGKMSADIELEGSGQGKIGVQAIQDLGFDAPGTLVDIGAILPNDSIVVERAETDDDLILRLRYQHESVLVSLQWC